MNDHYSLSELCEAFAVSRSGYHAWSTRAPSERDRADARLLPLIASAHTEGRREYGSPRVMRWLQKRGHRCGRRRIGRLMRQMGLSQRLRRRVQPMSLTDSNHALPVAPNLLMQRMPTLKPDAVWVADITYVATDEGWLYVAGVLDRCTRRCVGWAFDTTLATTLPLAALDMALKQRKPPAGLVHHSDRGVQYASASYRQRLAQARVIPSMSRRGNCYDNAEACAVIFEWIEVFYNRVRFHSALGCQSPVDFETQLN